MYTSSPSPFSPLSLTHRVHTLRCFRFRRNKLAHLRPVLLNSKATSGKPIPKKKKDSTQQKSKKRTNKERLKQLAYTGIPLALAAAAIYYGRQQQRFLTQKQKSNAATHKQQEDQQDVQKIFEAYAQKQARLEDVTWHKPRVHLKKEP